MLALASLVGALFMTAALPPTGSAAPQGPWQLPASDLSVMGQDASSPEVAIAPDGTATAVWNRINGSNGTVRAATRPPGGSFGIPVDLSVAGQDARGPQIAIAPDGTVTVGWRGDSGFDLIAQATTRPPGAPSFGVPVDLSMAGEDATFPVIAVAPDGTATAVWTRRSGSYFTVQAATRPPGGSFGIPVDLSTAGQNATAPKIAIALDGTATAVWAQGSGPHYVIQAATRPPGGSFGTPVDLSMAGQDAYFPEIATAPDGTTTTVWYRSNGSNSTIQSATRPPGGSFFGVPVDLSTPGQDAYFPDIATAPDGTTTTVWYGSNGSNDLIQAATRPSGSSFFGVPQDLSMAGQDSSAPRIAIAPDGTATVVWRRSNGSNNIVQAATRPPSGSFGPPEDLSMAGQDASIPRIAVGPDGTATAVWSRNNGSNLTIQQVSTEQPMITLAVSTSGDGSGKVTSSPAGINCGSDCTEDYLSFTKVTLTATPTSGSSFAGWSGACAGAAGNACEISMLEATEAAAEFIPNCKKATLKLKMVKPNRKNGTAKLTAKVGTAGKLILKGSKNNKQVRRKAGKAGNYRLKVKLKGKAAKKLKKNGSYRLKARVIFKPSNDCSRRNASKKVKLVRK